MIARVDMDGCDQDYDDECIVKYGETAHGKLYYTHKGVPANLLNCEIFGKVAGIWVAFPGECPVADGCAALEQGDCPVEDNEEIVYDIQLKVESFFPPVSLLKFRHHHFNLTIKI